MGVRVVLLLFVGFIAACGGSPARPGDTTPPPDSDATGQKCAEGDTYVVGPYTYLNNQWGRNKVPPGQTYQQCLQTRLVNGQTQYGWTFRWPGHEPSVYAYPEILFGWTPWGGGGSSDARFPMRIGGMPSVGVTYEVESVIGGYYNLAAEVWLTRTGAAGAPRPEDIATEIMFWLDYDASMRPNGRNMATVTIDGVAYDLYKADVSNAQASWTYLAYQGPRGKLAGALRLDAFIRDAVSRGYASDAHFVSGVEFGNECAGGTGTTWVPRYDVSIGH